MIIFTPLPCPRSFLFELTGSASERTDPPPACGALGASLSRCPFQAHIPLGKGRGREIEGVCMSVCMYEWGRERGSERAGPERAETREKEEEKSGAASQMALMAGILFTVTVLISGISAFGSSARIYPPNEGKKTASDFRLHPPSQLLTVPVCLRRRTFSLLFPLLRSHGGPSRSLTKEN